MAQQQVGPGVAGVAQGRARQPLHRAVHAEVQHHIGLEAVLQPAVEGGVLGMGREIPLVHQPHRITRHPQRWLHADPHLPQPHTTQQEAVAQGADAGVSQRPPLLLDAGGVQWPQPLPQCLHAHGGGGRAVVEALPCRDAGDPGVVGLLHLADQLLATGRQGAQVIALSRQRLQQGHQGGGHVEQGGGAGGAVAGGEAIQHNRQPALGGRFAA